MRKMQMRILLGALPILLFLWSVAQSQDASQAATEPAFEGISLRSFVDQVETPLNRSVTLVVRLQWTGNLQRFDILPFDNPILQNFDILGSGSSNTVSSKDGLETAVRDYTYTLKPQSIGMGYVEPIIIKYSDVESDADYILTSNRIPIKVTSSVTERSLLTLLAPIAIIVVFSLILIFFFRVVRSKKAAREKIAQENEKSDVPIEEKYLQELVSIVDLNDPSIDGVKVLSHMSRLLRRYLHEKFSAPGFEATTGELYQYLYENKFEDHFVNEMKDLLSTADVVKFSGKSVSRADVEKSYTVIENTFHKGQHNDLSHRAQPPAEEIDS